MSRRRSGEHYGPPYRESHGHGQDERRSPPWSPRVPGQWRGAPGYAVPQGRSWLSGRYARPGSTRAVPGPAPEEQYGDYYGGGHGPQWRSLEPSVDYGPIGSADEGGTGFRSRSFERRRFAGAAAPGRYFGTGHYGAGHGTYDEEQRRAPGGFEPPRFENTLYGRAVGRRPVSPTGRRSAGAPKGYRCSDERLWENICERLMQAEDIDSSDVSVKVQGARVILEGTVPERYMKHAIEDLVDACPGVQDIDNRIRVQRPQQERSETRGQGTESGAAAGRTRQGP